MCVSDTSQLIMIKINNMEIVASCLTTTDARKSEFSVIRESVGFNKINSMVFEQFREWVIEVATMDFEAKLPNLGDDHIDVLL